MSKILSERCPRCGEILTFTEQATHLTCSACGHSFLVAEFVVRQLEMEQARAGKAEAEMQRKAAEAEKAALQNRLNDTLSALQHIEDASQSGNRKLQSILDGMQEDRQSQKALTALLHAVKSDQARGQDTLTRLLQAVMQGQSGAEAKLNALEELSDRILQMQQAEGREARNLRRDLLDEIEHMKLDEEVRFQLADDFYEWSRRVQAEDVARLEALQDASGTLLKGQQAIADQLSGVEEKIAAAQAAVNAGFDKLQQQRLETLTELYHQATCFQVAQDFDKAESRYYELLAEGGKDASVAEVYWRILLCHYGVEYQQDGEEMIPIILRPDLSDPAAMGLRKELSSRITTDEQRSYYQSRLDKIDFYLERYRQLRMDRDWKYDVFISVKQSDGGHYTDDSDRATELYDYFQDKRSLRARNLRVFNSRRTPLPKGKAYEPYIMTALMSAKLLILVGSRADYLSSKWVRSEWMRFQYLQRCDIEKTGKTERRLFCYFVGGMQPSQLPQGLKPDVQGIMGSVSAGDALIEVVEEMFPLNAQQPAPVLVPPTQPEIVPPVSPRKQENAETIIKWMRTWLKLGQYKLVTAKYEELLQTRVDLLETPWICLYTLCAQHQCRTLEQLAKKCAALRTEALFELAYENADAALKTELDALSGKLCRVVEATYTYEGEMHNGRFHGHGTLIFNSGDKYVGEFREHKKHGQGVYTFADGRKYDGEWKDGQFNGRGVLITNLGRYEGEFANGKQNGHGVLTTTSGEVYKGQWTNGWLNGHGEFSDKRGNRYEGSWQETRFNGEGEYNYAAGETHGWKRYRGQYVKGVMQGQGEMLFANGSIYQGEWMDDLPNGRGVMHYTDGSRYDGSWRSGKREGNGVLYAPNGSRWEGKWKNDQKVLPVEKPAPNAKPAASAKPAAAPARSTSADAAQQQNLRSSLLSALNSYSQSKAAAAAPRSTSADGKKLQELRLALIGTLKAYGKVKAAQEPAAAVKGQKTVNYTYDGPRRYGVPHGKGKAVYENGSSYNGDWVHGQKEGCGTMRYQNGDQYIGEWKNDRKNGHGVMYYANGTRWEGEWKDDAKFTMRFSWDKK